MNKILQSLLIFALQAFAVNYYFDKINGSNSNAGRSATTPWKTFAKYRSLKVQAGDSILYLRELIS